MTGSPDFPTVNALYLYRSGGDAFIFKLSGDGQTVRYSTYLGGTVNDMGFGIAVDKSGNAYVTGYTDSDDFPRINALYPDLHGEDAFIAKIADNGDGGGEHLKLAVLDGQDFRAGAGISTDPSVLGSLSKNRLMNGVAADGEARLLLRARTSQTGSATFSIPAGDGELYDYRSQNTPQGATVTVPTVPVNGENMAFAVDRAPGRFARTGHTEDESIVQRDTTLTLNAPGGVTLNRILMLKRPPVVLIHGLWADQASWWDFEPKLKERIEGLRVYKANYDNAAHFASNRKVPFNFIKTAIDQYRQAGIAAVQADVFGHSMGGVLARRWTGDPEYKRNNNYQAGDINKLITIDSPHYGSPLGNIVFYNFSFNPNLANIFWTAGKPIDEGAIEDLQTDSNEVKNLNATVTHVPAHAVVGDYQFSKTKMEDFPGFIGWAWWVLDAPGLGIDTTRTTNFPHGTDGIVGVRSQKAGLPSPQTSTGNRIHLSEQDDELNGCLETDWMAERVKALLNATPDDAAFFRDGFPTASAPFPQAVRQRAKPFARPMAAGGLHITAPAEGTVVTPGQSVPVTVEPGAGVAPARMTLVTTKTVQALDAGPYQFTLVIPNDVVGPFVVAAVAKDTAGNLHDADLTLQVPPQSVLQRMGAEPDDFFFNEIGVTQRMAVRGYYADGSVRDLTAAGTTYQSSNPRMVAVDANGRLTAQGNGSATVTATNGGVSANVTVRVAAETDLAISQTDSPDPIGADGRVAYALTVQNRGAQTALDVEVHDTLPTGATLIQWTGANWSYIEVGGAVLCRRDALDAGASATLTLTVQVPLPCGAIANVASVTAGTHDPNAEDDVSSSASACPITYPLTVSKTGNGFGTVISAPAGINCGSDCGERYPGGTAVTLTAVPAVGATFAGWSGACSGTGICAVAMDAAKTVGAAFALLNPYDSDGDGILDAALDPDGDGMSSSQEYRTGSDPQAADGHQTCSGVAVLLLDRVYPADVFACAASASIRAGLPVSIRFDRFVRLKRYGQMVKPDGYDHSIASATLRPDKRAVRPSWYSVHFYRGFDRTRTIVKHGTGRVS